MTGRRFDWFGFLAGVWPAMFAAAICAALYFGALP